MSRSYVTCAMSVDMSRSSILQPAEPKTFNKERSSLNSLL